MSLKAASAWLRLVGVSVMRSSSATLRARVLYVLDVDAALPGHCHVEAWAPPVPGITEVLHARMVDYAYPAHCHQTWAVLILDDGAIRYDLHPRRCELARHRWTLV